MSVDQMMAHCNVIYEMVYENNHPKPNIFTRFMLRLFVKNAVVSDKPYKKNSRTAPQFKTIWSLILKDHNRLPTTYCQFNSSS